MWQGDPIFVTDMEVLNAFISKAADEGYFSALPGCTSKQRISIYTDDVTLFVRPYV
jgi:hypothetical protein